MEFLGHRMRKRRWSWRKWICAIATCVGITADEGWGREGGSSKTLELTLIGRTVRSGAVLPTPPYVE